MCTSTPLTLFNTSASPTIFSQEMNETSFHSLVSPIPELPQNNKRCISRIYQFLILFGILSCVSLLIYLTIHVNLYMKFSGGIESNLTIPPFGSINVSLQAEEVVNISSQINSNLNVKSAPSEMWKQVYLDDLLS